MSENAQRDESESDPLAGSKYDVALSGADLGPVKPNDHGGWHEFNITLTYYVSDTSDIVQAQVSAKEFFADVGDWPEGTDLP